MVRPYILGADRFFASRKACHPCCFPLDTLPLTVRQWTCPACGAVRARDKNAAKEFPRRDLLRQLHYKRSNSVSGKARP
ncbi:zinc ribbon domain-containing protein [Caballeronia sp.]|uniref:zinc ribbon domain-containing protein n=1 Tax=Caballeronia sp. TaxID=1931223 RepID=UPI003C70612A